MLGDMLLIFFLVLYFFHFRYDEIFQREERFFEDEIES